MRCEHNLCDKPSRHYPPTALLRALRSTGENPRHLELRLIILQRSATIASAQHLCKLVLLTRARIHTHTPKHMHTHTNTHTHTHINTHTYTHQHTHAHIHPPTHTRTTTHAHTPTHTSTHTSIHRHKLTHRHPPNISTHVHAHTHPPTHTLTHTLTHTPKLYLSPHSCYVLLSPFLKKAAALFSDRFIALNVSRGRVHTASGRGSDT